MESIKRRLMGLCGPPLVFWLLDCTITLCGQSAQYWAGNYAGVNEGSPTFHQLLHIHPAAFILGSLAWAMIFIGLIILLPDTLALITCIVVTFGHTAGAGTWLLWRFHYSYQVCIGLFLVSATLLGVGIRWGWRAAPEREYRLAAFSPLVRWTLAAMLVGVAMYLFLLPRMP